MLSKGETMLLENFQAILLRDIAGLERELALYPDEASIWKTLPGMPNSAGNIVLHLAGNLQHFFGAALGNTRYVRDRATEFSKRDVPRRELEKELRRARAGVMAGFATLTNDSLAQPFPVKITDTEFSTQLAILQLISHLDYHLGQLDYHRRAVTGDSTSANVVAAPELVRSDEERGKVKET
jgi:hypothetical protein